jgi:hypothetical protein
MATRRPERRIRVRGVRRHPPDIPKLARALLDLARAQAEADAEREHQQRAARDRPTKPRPEAPS